MKSTPLVIVYWVVTALFAAFMGMAGIVEAIQHESGREIMTHLGYPIYLLTVLGIGKVLGAVALLLQDPRFYTLKEWAYAGFVFTFVGAFFARLSAGDSVGLIISPLVFMAWALLSYYLWKKKKALIVEHE